MLTRTNIIFGTGGYGMDPTTQNKEIELIRYALSIGYNTIDTAEIYGHGNAELIVGEAIKGYDVHVITKVLPQNNPLISVYESLTRLKRDYIDTYLLHWNENTDMEKTLYAFIELKNIGVIRNYGVSNFDMNMLTEWRKIEERLGGKTSMHQFHISPSTRPSESFINYHRKNQIQICASSPSDNGKLPINESLDYVKSTADLIVVKSMNRTHIKTNYDYFH
jgi:diketogulonate reductase-like aldo/keto reductase